MSLRHEINITTKWGKLFKVKCMHDFYQDGITPDFNFVPTAETAAFMRNHHLLFRQQKAGFIILNNTARTESLIRAFNLGRLKKLSFFMKKTNKFFLNFSDVSFDNLDKRHYLSNSFTKQREDELNLIHPDIFLHNSPNLDILTGNREMRFTFPKMVDKAAIKLTNWEGTEIDINKLLQRNLPTKIEQIWFPLRNLPQGKYVFTVKGLEEQHFYITDDSDEPIWAVLDLFLSAKKSNHPVFGKKKLLKPDYYIQFKARETYWKYILIDQQQKGKRFGDAKVLLNGKELKFSKPQNITLNDGLEACFIESNKPIKLEQNISDSQKLELRLKNGSKWLPRVIKLPKPTAKTIKPDKETNKIYSTTYIYI